MTTDPQPLAAAIPERLKALAEERGLDLTSAADLDTARTETPEERAARRDAARAHANARWMERRPVMYADASLDDLDPASDAHSWWTRTRSATLVLAGSVGTGKTHAAYAIGNQAAASGAWVEAWTITDLLETMRPQGDPGAVRLARIADLLILDDLGASKASEFAVEQLTALVDARLRDGRRQIVTTNHPYDALEAAWGGRLMDRLRYRWTVQTMTGESRRKAAW